MKNGGLLKVIIAFLLIVFFCLLCVLILLMKDTMQENANTDIIVTTGEVQTVEEIAEESESKIIKRVDNTIYIEFAKDLYDENGNSNEIYFNNLIDKFKIMYAKQNFSLIDKKLHINIAATYNKIEDEYTVLINGIENYFKTINGEKYAKVNNITIGDVVPIFETDECLKLLSASNMNTRLLYPKLGEGTDLDNGYTSYLNDGIQLRTTLIKTVRNIIFTYKYDEEIVKGVKVGTSLKEIKELYPDNIFGGISENYLGYMTNDFYYFFYDDEISVYGVTYREDEEFEKILTEYINNKDLDKFVNSIKSKLRYYDYLEYDPEIKKAHIMFSSRGYEIDIEGNDPKGITLYNNYYFTDTTRNLAKEGIISIKEYQNLVDKIEKDRRKNR